MTRLMPRPQDEGEKRKIDLKTGWPSTSLLPTKALLSAASNVLTNPTVSSPALLYGADEGYTPVREELAKWLTEFYGDATNKYAQASSFSRDAPSVPKPDFSRIVLTGGASQSLGCILSELTDPSYTRNVWFIAPAYFMAFKMFADAGLKQRAVPQSLGIAWLRGQLQAADGEKRKQVEKSNGVDQPAFKGKTRFPKIYRHIIYVVPTFSNPTSVTMNIQKREELVRCARDFDALVICDDVYDMLQWPATVSDDGQEHVGMAKAPLPRLCDIDRYMEGGTTRTGADGFGNVISNGSFSKICAPGARCGWVESTGSLAHLVSQAGIQKSGGAPSQLTSAYMCDLLKTGELRSHILNTLQPAYARRYRQIMRAIQDHLLPLGVTLPQADRDYVGGYFLWLSLPQDVKGAAVAEAALADEQLVVAHGELFEVPGDNTGDHVRFDHHIRICFAWEAEEYLAEGIERLGNVISRVQRAG